VETETRVAERRNGVKERPRYGLQTHAAPPRDGQQRGAGPFHDERGDHQAAEKGPEVLPGGVCERGEDELAAEEREPPPEHEREEQPERHDAQAADLNQPGDDGLPQRRVIAGRPDGEARDADGAGRREQRLDPAELATGLGRPRLAEQHGAEHDDHGERENQHPRRREPPHSTLPPAGEQRQHDDRADT
jgi:hypothetical protein